VAIKIEDEKVLATMATAKNPELVQGPDGRFLGRFVPFGDKKVSFPEFGMTDEEIDAIDNDPTVKLYTADQVMERIRQLMKAK
jgi:hypothetical protein